jgi:hypothetical protein
MVGAEDADTERHFTSLYLMVIGRCWIKIFCRHPGGGDAHLFNLPGLTKVIRAYLDSHSPVCYRCGASEEGGQTNIKVLSKFLSDSSIFTLVSCRSLKAACILVGALLALS